MSIYVFFNEVPVKWRVYDRVRIYATIFYFYYFFFLGLRPLDFSEALDHIFKATDMLDIYFE